MDGGVVSIYIQVTSFPGAETNRFVSKYWEFKDFGVHNRVLSPCCIPITPPTLSAGELQPSRYSMEILPSQQPFAFATPTHVVTHVVTHRVNPANKLTFLPRDINIASLFAV